MLSVISKIKTWIAIAGGVTIGAVFLYLRGKSEGRQDAIDEHLQDVVDLNEQYDEIDSKRPDLNNSIGRLRDRSRK